MWRSPFLSPQLHVRNPRTAVAKPLLADQLEGGETLKRRWCLSFALLAFGVALTALLSQVPGQRVVPAAAVTVAGQYLQQATSSQQSLRQSASFAVPFRQSQSHAARAVWSPQVKTKSGLAVTSGSIVDGLAPPRPLRRTEAASSFAADAPPSVMTNNKVELSLVISQPDHLRDFIESLPEHPSPLLETRGAVPEAFRTDTEVIIMSPVVQATSPVAAPVRAFKRAGPRVTVAFAPSEVKAAIVTCGGLSPGLNTVVRELMYTLWEQYGVRNILGIRNGYQGLATVDAFPLTPERVEQIHLQGGTILGSSRGPVDPEKVLDALLANGINQVYAVGGDGTVRGATRIEQAARKRKVKFGIAVVPKTIDNDIPIIDKSFGFDTAVSQATRAIESGFVEASSYPNGLAVVKVMGRHAGFIAVHATLSARTVDLCLVPEQPFFLEGPGGVLPFLEERIKQNGRAVIVVAEGAGQTLMEREEKKKQTDESGNVALRDIGLWLSAKLKSGLAPAFKESGGVSLKYIDPSYMVRATAANPADNIYCSELAHACVHSMMHGFTGFMVGAVGTQDVLVPLPMVAGKTNIVWVGKGGRVWTKLLFQTGQPTFSNPPILPECAEDPASDDCELDQPAAIDLSLYPETAAGGCAAAKVTK